MAKYVGNIFSVGNDKLKIRWQGAHYVHVKWYNPVTKQFKCKVITSLDKKQTFPPNERKKAFMCKIVKKVDGDDFVVFSKSAYEKLRKGEIEPIPTSQTTNLENWSGYSKTVYLTRDDLKNKDKTKIINKKPWY